VKRSRLRCSASFPCCRFWRGKIFIFFFFAAFHALTTMATKFSFILSLILLIAFAAMMMVSAQDLLADNDALAYEEEAVAADDVEVETDSNGAVESSTCKPVVNGYSDIDKCNYYYAHSDWLPDSYVNNAFWACSKLPKLDPQAMCAYFFLNTRKQSRRAPTLISLCSIFFMNLYAGRHS
jgi:hypothetical protein